MVTVSNVNNPYLKTTPASPALPASGSTPVVNTAPTISTKNSSTVAISPPAAVKYAAVTAPQPVLTANAISNYKAAKTNGTLDAFSPVSIKDVSSTLTDSADNRSVIREMIAAGKITGIAFTDAKPPTFTFERSAIPGDLVNPTVQSPVQILQKITTKFTLAITNLTVSDALTIKPPVSNATLALSIVDTPDAVTGNMAALQSLAKTKTINSVSFPTASAGAAKPNFTITAVQLKSNPELLATIKGDYDLTITGVTAADAVTVAGSGDRVLAASGSQSNYSKVAITDTAANLVKSISILETAATAGRLASITVSDGKALVLTEAQIKADSHFLATQFTTNTNIEATAVAAADVTTVQSLVNGNSKLTLSKESIADTAANIQSNLDNLETAVKATTASSASSAFSIASIGVTDKGNVTVTNSTLLNDIDVLKVLSGKYTLNVTDITVSDALALKPPSKDATLAISVKDTAAHIAANWDNLQTVAKAKTLTSITVTDKASSLLSMTSPQLKSVADALKLVAGDYKLSVTGVAAADVAKTLTTKNIYSVEVKDSAANILKNLAAIKTAVTAAKIQNVIITDASNPTLSIGDILALTTMLPNVKLASGVQFNVKDTANMIIAHARDDIGDVLKNSGTVSLSDKTAPNLTLADAMTLKGIANLTAGAKYNVSDGGGVIATQAAIAGETILSGAASVIINKNFTVNDAKAITGIKTLAKGTVYSITDTANNILAQSAVAADKILTGANTVTVVDSSVNIIAKLDQLEALAKLGKIADIKFTDSPTEELDITQDQLLNDAEAIGKIISQSILPTLTLTKPATPAPLDGTTTTPDPTTVPIPSINSNGISAVTNNNRLTLSGTAVGNSTITLYNNNSNTAWATFQSDAGGSWSYTPSTALADGNYSITAKTSNADGIQSAASSPIVFTIDIVAPAAPVISQPSGTTAINQPIFSGTAEPNSKINLYYSTSNTAFATVTTGSNGQWSYTPPTALADGSYTLTAKAADAAGNLSTVSTARTFTINTASVVPTSMTWKDDLANGFEQISELALKDVATPSATVSETIALKAGASYSFTASSAYSYMTTEPTLSMQIVDANNTIVASSSDLTKALNFTPTNGGTYTIKLAANNPAHDGVITQYGFTAYQQMSKLPQTSGDANVDALLNGLQPFWLHPAGAVATKSTDLIHDGLYSLSSSSSKHLLTYSFLTSVPSGNTNDAKGFRVMNTTEKAAVQAALSYIASVINVTFTLATTPGQGDINFGTNNQSGVSAGYANLPNNSGNHPEYLFLANDDPSNSTFTLGSYGWQTMLHEIGHTLGLKHPGDYNAGGGGGTPPYLPTATDNTRFSIMSYNSPADVKVISGAYIVPVNPQSFMVYDLEALQYLYGANKSTSANQQINFTGSYVGMQTIWSPNGATINVSTSTKNNLFDLRQGAYSSVDMITPPSQTTYTGKNNVAIAYGSIVDTVIGGAGNDIIYANADGDMIDGGGGANTVYLPGSQSDWTITTDSATGAQLARNNATNKVTTLKQVQTIAYYNPITTALTHA